MTDDRRERGEDEPGHRNELTAPSGLRNAVQAGTIGKLLIGRPLHTYLGALLGAALVLVGALVWWTLGGAAVDGAASSSPTSTNTTDVPANDRPTVTTTERTTEPTTTTAEPPTTEPTTTSARPRPAPVEAPVLWQGSVKLRGDGGPRGGWYFDHLEPVAGFADLADLGFGRTAVQGHEVVAWRSGTVPEHAACAELLRSTVGSTRASAQVGSTFCFATREGRVGRGTVTGTSPADPIDPSTTLDVVVWDLAN